MLATLTEYTLIYASVLILVALGGMFAERSGVINIGLEGIMLIGALGGALAMYFLPTDTSAFLTIIITFAASMVAGALYSLLLAVAAVSFKADQTIVGVAMNIMSLAIATVVVKSINTATSGGSNVSSIIEYRNAQSKFLFSVGSMTISWFVVIAAVALIVSFVVLYKTRFGMRLMSCGEHPHASDSVGINVYKMRYIGVIISGILGGLGGITYIAAVNHSWRFEAGVSGFGFLALAVMIFGQWKPFKIALAALLFSVFRALSNVYSGSDFLLSLGIPGTVYNMLPYIISIIVLAFTSKKSRAPKAEGIPYDKGQR